MKTFNLLKRMGISPKPGPFEVATPEGRTRLSRSAAMRLSAIMIALGVPAEFRYLG